VTTALPLQSPSAFSRQLLDVNPEINRFPDDYRLYNIIDIYNLLFWHLKAISDRNDTQLIYTGSNTFKMNVLCTVIHPLR
jgi:hypothetical protein